MKDLPVWNKSVRYFLSFCISILLSMLILMFAGLAFMGFTLMFYPETFYTIIEDLEIVFFNNSL